MSKGEVISITRRQLNQLRDLCSGVEYVIQVKTKYQGHVLEVEDAHFHLDSAVMLPDYGDLAPAEDKAADKNKITGIAILIACFDHAKKHPDQKALVVGHTDRSGGTVYNQTLSELRSKNVLCALQGDRSGWVDVAEQKHKVEDYQQILRWLTFGSDWNCDPGPKDGKDGPKTKQAVRDFQEQYKQRFETSISVDGVVGRETWGAFFDVYMQDLKYVLGTDESGLKDAQNSLHFMTCKSIGCGEQFPITPQRAENYTSQIDRRVEILFFDPGEEPVVDCSSSRGACVELYEKKMYDMVPIERKPLPISNDVAVHVFLQLAFKDPDPAASDHVLPEGLPVTIEYANGASQQLKVGAEGKLDFLARRENKAFTLRFQFDNVSYIASPTPGGSPKDKIVTESDIDTFIKGNDKHRIFKLPKDWHLADSTWKVTGAPIFDQTDSHFKKLDDLSTTTVGSAATPVKLVLDPKWQYLRFEFFDRTFGHEHHSHKRVCIPPVLLEGFHRPPAAGKAVAPETRCKWMIRADDLEKACLCLPWILQKGKDVVGGGPMPDNQVVLQFQTEANTFIHSENEITRKLEVVTDPKRLEPSLDRMALYDLPELWKSHHYFTRPVGGGNDFFQNLTPAFVQESLDADKFLTFSMDDIVLVERVGSTGNKLRPVTPGADDRVAIFFHQFAAPKPAIPGVTISPQGVYEPSADATKKYFPFSDIILDGSYVPVYPNWTRLVLLQGNLFDVFGERTPEGPGHDAVGARAAVRWVDAVAAGAAPGTTLNPRPGLSNEKFFSIQPFFSQDMHRVRGRDMAKGTYKEWESPVAGFAGWFYGRFDMVLLRCSDVEDGKEVAVNMQLFKFFLDYTNAPATINQASYKTNMLEKIPLRWNGPDEPGNPGGFSYSPQAADGPKLKVKPFWFIQDVPKPQAHFQINVISIPRANMSASGIGNFSAGDDTPASAGETYTAAHEAGHGGSLPDEYNERWSSCSYYARGFTCNVPGDPYTLVSGAMMMEGTRDIQARYFWQAAEWSRVVTGTPLQVEITKGGSTRRYHIRSHPSAPQRAFLYFPLFIESNATIPGRGLFDLYLYQLGDDQYASNLKAGKSYDAILIVLVKIKFAFPDATAHDHIVDSLNSITAEISSHFNDKFEAKGSIAGVDLDHCLVLFSPRFLVENLIIDLSDADNVDYLESLGYTVTPASGATPASTTATQVDYTKKVAAIEKEHPRHFMVTVGKGVAAGWTTPTDLNIRLNVTTAARAQLGVQFWRLFGDMVGLNLSTASPPNNVPTKAGIQHMIVQRAIPGATVS